MLKIVRCFQGKKISKTLLCFWFDGALPGPVLSRFDRFLLIGPCAKGGHALRILPPQTYTFYRSCLFVEPARGSVFFQVF